MNRYLLIVVLMLGISVYPVHAADKVNQALPFADTGTTLDSIRSLHHTPFAPGEKITLKATYLGLTAGYINMELKADTIGGRGIYKLDLRASTSGMVDYIYSLRDRFVSYFDRRGLFSWGYDYHQLHNGTNETRTVRYYHERGYFTENGERKGPIQKYTQDLLATMYYLRARKLNDGDTLSFPLQTGDESYDVRLEVNGDARVATKEGWKDAYELKPVLRQAQQKEHAQEHVESISGIRVWFSHDDRRIPLKISFPATFGQLNAFLEEYSAP